MNLKKINHIPTTNSNFSYLGECHTLLEQGPCQRNHWLVANDFENKHFADCKRRLC